MRTTVAKNIYNNTFPGIQVGGKINIDNPDMAKDTLVAGKKNILSDKLSPPDTAEIYHNKNNTTQDLDVKIPLGESGQGKIDNVKKSNALIQLFSFESQHATAQRRKLSEAGAQNAQVNIRFKIAIDKYGTPIPTAAVTETTADLDGRGIAETVMREFATISSKSQLLAAGGTNIFGFAKRPMPQIRHAGTAASAYRVMQNRKKISTLANAPGILSTLHKNSAKEIEKVIKALEPIEQSLTKLQTTLNELNDDTSLTVTKVKSNSSSLSAKIINRTAKPGDYIITINKVAVAHSVEGKLITPLYPEESALGLSGSFKLNGISVNILSTDTLSGIAEKINYGEDLNRNGKLDSGGIAVSGYPEEDANSNRKLDGGTIEHGVNSMVTAGKLRLTAAIAGPQEIQAEDADGILAALGLVENDEYGKLKFSNILASPNSSSIVIAGNTFQQSSNTIENALPGLRLNLKSTSKKPVTLNVEADPEALATELEKLVTDFNQAMNKLNQALNPKTGLLADVQQISRVRINLNNNTLTPVPGQPSGYTYAQQTGLLLKPGNKVSFFSLQLDQALVELKQILNGPQAQPNSWQQQKGIPSVYNSLHLIGITSESDDTLSLDREKLLQAVGENLDAVRSLFSKEEGYIPRLAATVDEALKSGGGLLPLARNSLLNLLGSFNNTQLQQQIAASRFNTLAQNLPQLLPTLNA